MHVLIASLLEEAYQDVYTTPNSKFEIPAKLWLAEGKVNTVASAPLFDCCFYPLITADSWFAASYNPGRLKAVMLPGCSNMHVFGCCPH